MKKKDKKDKCPPLCQVASLCERCCENLCVRKGEYCKFTYQVFIAKEKELRLCMSCTIDALRYLNNIE